MTADRNGLTLSSNSLKWFNIVVAACALLGPPTVFFVSIAVFKATQQQIDARQDERIAEHRILIDKSDAKFDRINDRLSNIESGLNQLIGKLAK